MNVRAARCLEYGSPANLVVESVDLPDPGPGEVLVEVHAAAVNFPDVLIVANEYQVRAPLPFTPGSELAGVVTAVGDDVADLAPGDQVFGQVFVARRRDDRPGAASHSVGRALRRRGLRVR